PLSVTASRGAKRDCHTSDNRLWKSAEMSTPLPSTEHMRSNLAVALTVSPWKTISLLTSPTSPHITGPQWNAHLKSGVSPYVALYFSLREASLLRQLR